MSVQVTIGKSFYDKLEAIEEEAKREAVKMGQEIVEFAVSISKVDTGAYVESFSVVPRGAGGGRSRSSRNKPKASNPEALKAKVIGDLKSSVASMDLSETGGFTLRNRAPHANYVELRYLIFDQTRNRFL